MPVPAVGPVAVVLVAGVLGAGCSGDDARPDVFTSGLFGALGKVQANGDTRVAVEYGAPARVRELGERFRTLEGYGFGTVASTATLVDDAIGVDPGAFDEAVVVGRPPRWGAVLWGDYEVDTVDDRLAGMGIDRAEEDAGTRWTGGEDFEIDFDGPFAGVVRTNQFNSIRTADGVFAYAPAAAGVDWVTDAGDTTLAEDERVGGLGRCLGDVVAARIEQEAAGVREDGTEVSASTVTRPRWRRRSTGVVPSTREPWNELLPGAKVDQDGGDRARRRGPARRAGSAGHADPGHPGAGVRRAPPAAAGGALHVHTAQRP